MHKLLSLILAGALCPAAALLAETNLEGTWQLEMDSPHGRLHGPLDVKQDGSKLACTYQVGSLGNFDVTGKVQGDKVTLEIHVPGGDMTFKLSGTVDSEKMSGTVDHGGSWAAARTPAVQKPVVVRKSILGTVTRFRMSSLELAVKPD